MLINQISLENCLAVIPYKRCGLKALAILDEGSSIFTEEGLVENADQFVA